jgi:hypothetical protein
MVGWGAVADAVAGQSREADSVDFSWALMAIILFK